MKSSLSVSIVIPAYNEERLIAKCLESIQRQTVAPQEVIIVDNNCTDNTVAIAKQYGATIVPEPRQGITYARTTGFNAAKHSIIGRIDADSCLRDDWVATVIDTFEKDTQTIGITGSSALYTLGSSLFMGRWLFYIFLRKSVEIPMRVSPWLFGHNMAIRKTAWHKIKKNVSLGDTDINEDLDLTLHLRKIGKLRYIHRLVVRIHIGRQLFNPKKMAAYSRAAKRTLKQHSR